MSGLKAKISSALTRSPSPSPRNSVDLSSTSNGNGSNVEGDKYRLLVTAGPSYDTSTHKIVHVNTSTPCYIENKFLRAQIKVRIRGFRGLPSSSPASSPYFEDPAHLKDQYSVAATFVPKQDLPAKDLIWGNDFDHPVRDRLPPGFNTAFDIVKKFIDPGLECDAYADEPWLYGPALSCWFGLHVGDKLAEGASIPEGKGEGDDVLVEGGSGTGVDVRQKHGLPANSEKRRKYFLSAPHREGFTFEKDRVYSFDFFNPYLDFGNFSLKLPGFSIKVLKYVDEKSHTLRYVLKNRQTGDVYLCVNFNLLWGEQLEKATQGQMKAWAGAKTNGDDEVGGEERAGKEIDGRPVQTERLHDGETNYKARRDEHVDGSEDPETRLTSNGMNPVRRDMDVDGSADAEKQTSSNGAPGTNPGLRDKPDWLREQVQRMSISDTLQQTATADKQSGKAGGVLDDDDVD